MKKLSPPRYLMLFLSLACLLFAAGCEEKTASTICLIPEDISCSAEVPDDALVVNISSKTIHKDPTCPHAEKIGAANRRFADRSEATVNTLLAMGYRFCSYCTKPEESEEKSEKEKRSAPESQGRRAAASDGDV